MHTLKAKAISKMASADYSLKLLKDTSSQMLEARVSLLLRASFQTWLAMSPCSRPCINGKYVCSVLHSYQQDTHGLCIISAYSSGMHVYMTYRSLYLEAWRYVYRLWCLHTSSRTAGLLLRFLDSGGVYKLAFGPKAFIVVSDPVVVRHLLKVGCSALRLCILPNEHTVVVRYSQGTLVCKPSVRFSLKSTVTIKPSSNSAPDGYLIICTLHQLRA